MANDKNQLAVLGGVLQALGGDSRELQRLQQAKQDEALRAKQEKELAQVGQVLSGQIQPLAPDVQGARLSPEMRRLTPQEQVSQLAQLGTPLGVQTALKLRSEMPTEFEREEAAIKRQQAQQGLDLQRQRIESEKSRQAMSEQQFAQSQRLAQQKEARLQRDLEMRQNLSQVLAGGMSATAATDEPLEIDINKKEDLKGEVQRLETRKRQFSAALTDPALKDAAKFQIEEINKQIKNVRNVSKEKNLSARSLMAQGIEIGNITNLIDKVKGQAGFFTTGLLGATTGQIAGTDAYNLRSNLNTLQAYAGFDKLQAMREASPTGGALGSVSERELALLQSAVANLDASQSSDQFTENLERFENQIKSSWNNVLDAYKADFGTLPKGTQGMFKQESKVIDFAELP